MNKNQLHIWEVKWAQTRINKIHNSKKKKKKIGSYNKLLKIKSKHVKAARDIKDTLYSSWQGMAVGLISQSSGTGAHAGGD